MNKNCQDIEIVGVCAPGEDADGQIKDYFYSKLYNVLSDNINTERDVLVEWERNNPFIYRYGEPERNDNGRRLIEIY